MSNQQDNQNGYSYQGGMPYFPQNYYNTQNYQTQNQPPYQTGQSPQQPFSQLQPPAAGDSSGMLPMEQSYIENILRLNKGKEATIYMTFENNTQWNAKVFKGIIEAAGRDHIIISDTDTGKRVILLMVYLDYITFDEEIVYNYPINMTQYSPR